MSSTVLAHRKDLKDRLVPSSALPFLSPPLHSRSMSGRDPSGSRPPRAAGCMWPGSAEFHIARHAPSPCYLMHPAHLNVDEQGGHGDGGDHQASQGHQDGGSPLGGDEGVALSRGGDGRDQLGGLGLQLRIENGGCVGSGTPAAPKADPGPDWAACLASIRGRSPRADPAGLPLQGSCAPAAAEAKYSRGQRRP